MWIPGIKVGDKKWIIFTINNRMRLLKVMESAILCDESTDANGEMVLKFASNNKDQNSALVDPLMRWFSTHKELKAQGEATKRMMDIEKRQFEAGLAGVVGGHRGHGDPDDEVSH